MHSIGREILMKFYQNMSDCWFSRLLPRSRVRYRYRPVCKIFSAQPKCLIVYCFYYIVHCFVFFVAFFIVFFGSLATPGRLIIISKLYQIFFLCFILLPALYIFTKFLKVPIAFLHWLGTIIIIYLENILIIGKSVKETLNFRDAVILYSQELRVAINQEKSVMIATQVIKLLGMEIDSNALSISLPQEKVQKIKLKCQNLYQSHNVSISELIKVLGHLTSTIQTVLPARIYLRSLQQQQIQALRKEGSYKDKIVLNRDSKQ